MLPMQANTFTFQGILLHAEPSFTKGGKSMCKFSLQNNGIPGQYAKTTVLNFISWGKAADIIATVPAHSEVLIMGELNSSEYKGKYYPELLAKMVYPVDMNQAHPDMLTREDDI